MKETVLAAGGAVSALAASTCCVVPLALVSVGVSGAWVGSLSALAAYQPLFVAVAVVSLGAGFWLVYRRPSRDGAGGACAVSGAGRILRSVLLVKGVLWLGAALVALSFAGDYAIRMVL